MSVRFWQNRVLFAGSPKAVAMAKPCCCECATCQARSTPDEFKVVISGIVNQDCDNCVGLNGTWYLTRVPTNAGCCWFLNAAVNVCGAAWPATFFTLCVAQNRDGSYQINFAAESWGGDVESYGFWCYVNLADRPACNAIAGQALGNFTFYNGYGNCDYSSISVTVSAA